MLRDDFLKKLFTVVRDNAGNIKRAVFPTKLQVGLPNTTDGELVSYGPTTSYGGFTGSLMKLPSGISYLVAGSNTTVTSGSNGQVTISTTGGGGGGGASTSASYVTLAADSGLTAERTLTAGTGIRITDAGANSTVTLAVNDGVVATITGSTFSGVVKSTSGFTGSLTNLTDGTSYLIAGSNVTITTGSNNAITIAAVPNVSSVTGTWRDPGNAFITTGSVSIDTGNRTATTLGTDVFFFVSGSVTSSLSTRKVALFGGEVVSSGTLTALAGLSGSLTKLANGTSYLIAGSNVTITTGSNNAITITAANAPPVTGTWRDPGNTFVTTGSVSIDTGNRTATTLGTDVFFFVSGSVTSSLSTRKVTLFGGDVAASGTLTAMVGGAQALTFGTSGSIAGITQSPKTAASAVGSTFTIKGQDSTGATSTGGILALVGGSGTSTNGSIDFFEPGSTVGIRFRPSAGTVAAGGNMAFSNASSIYGRGVSANDICGMMFFGDGLIIGASSANTDIPTTTDLRANTTLYMGVGSSGAQMTIISSSIQMGLPVIGFDSYNSPWGVHGLVVKATADANVTVANTVYKYDHIQFTGALSAVRTMTFPHPASAAVSYWKTIENACTLFSITVSTGTGTTVSMYPGQIARVHFTNGGASFGVTFPKRTFTRPSDAAYQVLGGDDIIRVTTLGADRTHTLPANPIDGQTHTFKVGSLAGFTLTISGSGHNLDRIDGTGTAAAITITADRTSVTYVYDATNTEWSLI